MPVLSVSAGTSLCLVLPIVVAVGTPGKSTGTPCLPTVLDFTAQILFMLLGVKSHLSGSYLLVVNPFVNPSLLEGRTATSELRSFSLPRQPLLPMLFTFGKVIIAHFSGN